MSNKTSILRAVFDNPTVQNVDAGGIIQFPDVTVNECCITPVNGGIITLRNNSKCNTNVDVQFNCTLVATAAGAVEVQMYRNGAPVPGAHALGTAAAIGDNIPLSFSTVITADCCNETIDFRCINATSVRVANAILEG